MFVLTIDQRGSTGDRDRVPELVSELSGLSGPGTGAAFERSVGDEVQGVIADPGQVVDAALHALRSGHWYVGIGVGHVVLTPGASSREGSGTGFVAARQAVEAAKSAGSLVPLSVVSGTMGRDIRGGPAGDEGVRACANAEAVLRLLGRLVQERTDAQWRVADALRRLGPDKHGRQKQVARELGITEQSVSRTLIRSGWQEEWAARPAAAMLLEYARTAVVGPGGGP
ncbi:MarR family transcriptional regulator [Pseudarthrobacter sp. NPDC092439]|uniref:MarR family transcriptional regulator n=1 Tax=unclassified Pseudarthrobacter TaxID=2647000 RepID=UPI0038284DA7